MKSLLKIFAIALFLFAGMATNASAANVDMTGYAWGADSTPFGGVGWINFNNTQATGSKTSVGTTEYKVEFNQTSWELVGYAWSERYGYIKFGGFDDGDFPSAKTACEANPKNTGAAGPCNVHMISNNSGGFLVVGYARFCFVYASGCSGSLKPASELGGYDGWIAFKYTPSNSSPTSYVTYDRTTFGGYAWGGGSSTKTNSNYAEGSGWIKMKPSGNSNTGVMCVDSLEAVVDCTNSDGPKITLEAIPDDPIYGESVLLKWKIENNPTNTTCTASTSSSPTNSTWNGYTPSGAKYPIGEEDIGQVTETTTFTLSCIYNGKKGSADVIVTPKGDVPNVTITNTDTLGNNTDSVIYDQDYTLAYSVTNIPFGCDADIYRNGTKITNTSIPIAGDTTKTYTYSDTYTIQDIKVSNNIWEVQCVDDTPPSPNRIGSDTQKTILDPTSPVISFEVKDTDTNSTTNIPCTNNGVTISYNIDKVLGCTATVDGSGSTPGWGSSTTIVTNGTDQTSTTGAVTATPTIQYRLQCTRLSGAGWNSTKTLSRTCTPASLTMSAPTCVEPNETFSILYTGAGIQNNTCKKSGSGGFSGTIQGGNPFTTTSTPISSALTQYWTDGQTKTYTIHSCIDASNPSATPLTQTVNIDVKTSCASTKPPCVPTSRKLCDPATGTGPIFKEF